MNNKNELFLGGEKIKTKNFSNSSTIASAKYNIITKQLIISFTTGTVYQYSGVPENIVDELFNSSSPGKYLNNEVKKGAYIFKKL